MVTSIFPMLAFGTRMTSNSPKLLLILRWNNAFELELARMKISQVKPEFAQPTI